MIRQIELIPEIFSPGTFFFFRNGRGNPAPTLTRSAYAEFGTIRGLFIVVKVGARSPRPHLFGVFSDSLNIYP